MRARHLTLVVVAGVVVSGGLVAWRAEAQKAGVVNPQLAPKAPPTATTKALDPGAELGCPDRDNDGHRAASCGGDDCDDNDPRRNPGMREVCDPQGRDEDCNACTVGEVVAGGVGGDADRDYDGVPSAACTNPLGTASPRACDGIPRLVVVDGDRVRGADCDDRNAMLVPGAMFCAKPFADTIQVCTTSATGLPSLPKSALTSYDPRTATATASCPAGTRCLPQPNGTGVCSKP